MARPTIQRTQGLALVEASVLRVRNAEAVGGTSGNAVCYIGLRRRLVHVAPVIESLQARKVSQRNHREVLHPGF